MNRVSIRRNKNVEISQKCSAAITIREMKTKTTLKLYPLLFNKTKVNKIVKTNAIGFGGKEETLFTVIINRPRHTLCIYIWRI